VLIELTREERAVVWAAWDGLWKQMDASRPKPEGRCQSCGSVPASLGHINCNPCRIAAGGYRFARA
jgi:hypothetical protein